MSKKHLNVCTDLNYMEHLLILAFVISEFVSILAFTSLLLILIGIVNSAIGLKIVQ